MRRLLSKLTRGLVIVAYLVAVLPIDAYAQGIDVDGPLVVLDQPTGISSNTEVDFSLSATDEGGIESVTLFFRLSGEQEYESILMQRDLDVPDRYEASVENTATSNTAIEYYIQAEDAVGNIVLKGFSFDPLVRQIAPPTSAQDALPALADSSANQATDTTPAPEAKSKKLLYTILGVLAVGVIASLANRSSDDDDPVVGTDSCHPLEGEDMCGGGTEPNFSFSGL